MGVPFFPLIHDPPSGHVGPGRLTDGIESALEQARGRVGDRDIAGLVPPTSPGYLRARLLDEIVGVVPLLPGAGVGLLARLEDHQLDLDRTRLIESDGVTHLRHRVVR